MVFSISATQAAAIIAILATSVHGHVVMLNPPPFEYAVPASSQSPLDPTGADFPCKFPAGFTPQEQAPTPLNATANFLALQGGATHGGGSCQISLTTDPLPTKDSKWQVIKSVEGGCPSDAEGNASESADTPLPLIEYTVPAGMAPGTYTLAWTWFNKIGNREMYMNCAPVEIGGAPAKREMVKINKKRQSALPDIFLANIGNGCSTTEGTDVTFPDPGADLVQGAGATPGEPTGTCAAAGAGADNSTAPADTTAVATGDDAAVVGAEVPATGAEVPATGAEVPAPVAEVPAPAAAVAKRAVRFGAEHVARANEAAH